jgi:hypothetical protein
MSGFAFNPRNAEASNWNQGWEINPSSNRANSGSTGANVNAFQNLTGDSSQQQSTQCGQGCAPESFNWSSFFSGANTPSQPMPNFFNNTNLSGSYSQFQFNPQQTPSQGTSSTSQPTSSQATPSTSQGTPSTQKANTPVNTALVEVGAHDNGTVDDHAKAVDEIYKKQYGDGAGKTDFYGLDDSPETSTRDTGALNDKKTLDTIIDNGSKYSLDTMRGKVDTVVKDGKDKVVNGSLGYCRDDIYSNLITSLKPGTSPEVLKPLGLTQDDVKAMPHKDGQILVPDKVAKGVIHYVDNHMDAKGSTYQNALAKYQQATQNAANHGVTVVVASGNSHEMNVHKDTFAQAKPGADTNFLAQSDKVLVAAASDDKKTPNDPKDDTIAPFSSYGTGRYNPTVAVNGVDVQTKQGSLKGTSFSAPQLAATVARMKEANPNSTFEQEKADLQNSASKIDAPGEAQGAGIMDPNRAIQEAAGNTETKRTA